MTKSMPSGCSARRKSANDWMLGWCEMSSWWNLTSVRPPRERRALACWRGASWVVMVETAVSPRDGSRAAR